MQVQSHVSVNQANPSSSAAMGNSVDGSNFVSQTKLTPPSTLNQLNTTPVSSTVTPPPPPVETKNVRVKAKRPGGSKKQIPTVLGLLILFAALISGVLLFGQGTGVFAPRATPETTPQNIQISNVTDKTFTISFYTSENTIAFVKYGEDANALNKQASDDRDQLSGVVKNYYLHHITVRSLNPAKTYYYVLGTGSNTFDNEGQPYSIKTAAKPNQSPINNQTIYGNVLKSDATPAEGAVVYLYSEGMGALSTLVKSSGSWGISLANAFNFEKTAYAVLTDGSLLDIKVQGVEPDSVATWQNTIALAAPVPDITLGQSEVAGTSGQVSPEPTIEVDKEELLAGNASSSPELEFNASSSTLSSRISAIEQPEIMEEQIESLDLGSISEASEASATTIQTTQPQIKAVLPANTMVRIVVHSDTQIDETVQTDENGNFVLDVASLGQNLEPGEHSATYTYIDPITGEEVTKTYNFTVDPKATPRQIAAISATPTPTPTPKPSAIPSIPYGSGNPYSPPVTITPASSTVSASISSGSAIVATDSGQYRSGSVGTTITLLVGGLFFVLTGIWSYSLAGAFDGRKRR